MGIYTGILFLADLFGIIVNMGIFTWLLNLVTAAVSLLEDHCRYHGSGGELSDGSEVAAAAVSPERDGCFADTGNVSEKIFSAVCFLV